VDALMLSGETANGKYPEVAVRTMAKIAKEVEDKKSSYVNVPYTIDNTITAYLAKAAVKASLRLETKGIVADSFSGRSIRALAAYRGDSPIYAQVYNRQVMRQLSLSFGVFADYVQMDVNSIKPLKKAVSRLVEEKCFKDDDLIIVLAGSFGMRHGASYIEISTAQNFKKRQT